jgi:hypothetical protein
MNAPSTPLVAVDNKSIRVVRFSLAMTIESLFLDGKTAEITPSPAIVLHLPVLNVPNLHAISAKRHGTTVGREGQAWASKVAGGFVAPGKFRHWLMAIPEPNPNLAAISVASSDEGTIRREGHCITPPPRQPVTLLNSA